MAGCIAAGSGYESGCTGVSRSANRVAFVRTVLERNAGEKLQLGLFVDQGFHFAPLVREPLRVDAHVVCPKHVRTHNQRRLASLNASHRKQIQPYLKSRILANGTVGERTTAIYEVVGSGLAGVRGIAAVDTSDIEKIRAAVNAL